MDKLSDLELEKRIAKIEGIEVSESVMMVKADPIPTGRGLITDEYIEFNPLTDKALLWDLAIKYRVKFDWVECPAGTGKAYFAFMGIGKVTDYCGTPERAVLECIVEANNG
jgi:hypothetical protein